MGNSAEKQYGCIASSPVSLSSGRPVSPGERFPLAPTEHDLRLVDAGLIQEITPERDPVDLHELKREQLNELAAEAGVEDPASFKSKADIIDAIRALEAGGEHKREGE